MLMLDLCVKMSHLQVKKINLLLDFRIMRKIYHEYALREKCQYPDTFYALRGFLRHIYSRISTESSSLSL